MLAQAARLQVHQLRQDLFELRRIDLPRAVEIDIERQRIGNADRVGNLDAAAVGEAGGDHVLREIPRGIGRRTVDLGRVLAGEGAAAVRCGTTIRVDDDLAAGETGVAVGTADDESAGRIDVPDGARRQPALGHGLPDIGFDDLAHMAGFERGIEMLGRDHDLRRFDRPAAFVAERHLGLRVGAELRLLAGVACVRHQLEDLVRIVERRRHQALGLVDRIAEHDALVARALVLVVLGVHALGDVRRLFVQQHLDVAALPVEPVLLVADVAYGEARRVDDHILRDLLGPARLARDDDAVGRRQRLAGHAQILGREAVLRP